MAFSKKLNHDASADTYHYPVSNNFARAIYFPRNVNCEKEKRYVHNSEKDENNYYFSEHELC